jgi:chemotaxis protein CheZ
VIADWVHSDRRDPAGITLVAEKVNAIFEACTFQDITGQRIRRAIEHLQRVETMLTEIMPATVVSPEEPAPPEEVIEPLAQNDVDRLFD